MKKIVLAIAFFTSLSLHSNAQIGVWTWMKGDSVANQQGVYGTQGIFAPNNTPPAIYEGCEWTDKQGNFWLFGGQDSTTFIRYSDLWEFKPSINQWAWIKGPGISNQSGIYGTYQVPSAGNNPGARNFGWPSWVDTTGDLWLCAGYGYDVNGSNSELNDMWRYHIATNEWTWMKGSSTVNPAGSFGTFQVENITNEPPARCEYSVGWRDNFNNLWMFGGFGPSGGYNDMWRYNIQTNNWTWMKGANFVNQAATYGTINVEAATNTPGNRWSFSHWVDLAGNLYLFGGTNGLQIGAVTYNDLWRFNVTNNNWTWISGTNLDNDTGVVGPICTPSPNYYPSSRFENRACWTRPGDNFELFGGSGTVNNYNDVWNYNVATNSWAWISGSINANQTSVFGTKGVPNPANHPGSRDGSLGWTDNQGNLWLFGGFQANGQMYNENGKMFNDLWRWTPDTIPPIPNFTVNPDSGCAPLTVTFSNTSVNSTTYYWDFGDGNNSVSPNPTHTYVNPGTYTVKLIAANSTPCASGIDSIIKINIITVLPAPTGTFIADTLNGCDSLTVHFTQQTVGAVSYLWKFGDGSTSTLPNPTHTYHNTGIYTDTLIARGLLCNDTIIRVNYITVIAPQTVTSAFVADTFSGCVPLTVNFTNNSVNGTSFLWNFGDGNTSTTANPSNIFTHSGTYTVKLVSYNTSVCGLVADSVTHIAYITVYPYAHASFTEDSINGCAPMHVHFTNTSDTATNYLWNFGDGNTSTATNPSNIYHNHGTYTVTLIAFGAGGCNDTATFSSIIVDTLPIISSAFVADTFSGCNPFTVNFTNNSINGLTYVWRFGDGDTSIQQNPTHIYHDSGYFTVTLVVVNNSPCGRVADSITHTSYIHVENPITVNADFTAQPIIGCAPLTVTFANNSSNANAYYWNFGDGKLDTAKNPTHTFYYTHNGKFKVTLVVSHFGQKCYNAPDTATLDINVDTCELYIPNVFSPNGDGKNDNFWVIAEGYTLYHLIIFDRWGLKVFESNDKTNLWNGLINNTGGKAPDGTYYYIFSAADMNGILFQDHGYLTLIR